MKILQLKCPKFPEEQQDNDKLVLGFLDYKIENHEQLSRIAVNYMNGIEVNVSDINYIEGSINDYMSNFKKNNVDKDITTSFTNFKNVVPQNLTEKTRKTIKKAIQNATNVSVNISDDMEKSLNFISNHAKNEVETYIASIAKLCEFHKKIETNQWSHGITNTTGEPETGAEP